MPCFQYPVPYAYHVSYETCLFMCTHEHEIPTLHIFISPSAAIGPMCYCPRYMYPSVHPERLYRSNSLKISVIGLGFDGMMHSIMKQSNRAKLGQLLSVSRKFHVFLDKFWPGLGDDITASTLYGFHLLAWKMLGWCSVQLSRLLFKMAMLGHFCAFHVTSKFPMISSDQDDDTY